MEGNEFFYPEESFGWYPMFDRDSFSMWKFRTLMFFNCQGQGYPMEQVVANGPYVPVSKDDNSSLRNKPLAEWTVEDKRRVNLDARAMWYICNALPDDVYHCVDDCCTAKEMLEALSIVCEGAEETKEVKRRLLTRDFELFVAYNGETLTHTYDRFNRLVYDLSMVDIEKNDYQLVNKFMDSLTDEWELIVTILRYNDRIKTMTLHSLYAELLSHERRTQKKTTISGEEAVYPPEVEVDRWYPVFDRDNFSLWKRKLLLLLKAQHYDMDEVIANDNSSLRNKPSNQWTDEEKRRAKFDARARCCILNCMQNNVHHVVMRCDTAKKMLEALSNFYEGTEMLKVAKKKHLQEYGCFNAYNGETITQTYIRFKGLVNDLKRAGIQKDDSELVKKFLYSLSDKWELMKTALQIRIKTLTLVRLYDILLSHELLKTHKIGVKNEVVSASRRVKNLAL